MFNVFTLQLEIFCPNTICSKIKDTLIRLDCWLLFYKPETANALSDISFSTLFVKNLLFILRIVKTIPIKKKRD